MLLVLECCLKLRITLHNPFQVTNSLEQVILVLKPYLVVEEHCG